MNHIRRAPLAVILLTLSMDAHAAVLSGTWMANVRKDGKDLQVDLSDSTRGGNQGFGIPLSSLIGLEKSQITSTSPAAVSFDVRSAAGTFHFEGSFAAKRGAGHYTFTPSETYVTAMRELGYGGFSDRTLLLHAMTRLSPESVRELRSMGYTPSLKELDKIAIFEITPGYVREIAAAGFEKLSLRELEQFRIGDIDANRIREYRALGLEDLSPRSISQLGIHGVTAAFVKELEAEGYENLSASELQNLAIGDISAGDIREYRALGYDNIPPRELANLGIHNVSPEFIRSIAKAGYRNVPLKKLIQMKIHDITPEYIESLRAAGAKP